MATTINIGTHDGVFHADDVLAVALIKQNYIASNCNDFIFNIIRSRKPEVLEECQWIVDVGGMDMVDVGHVCFDHHQKDSESYPNGIKMAACGKVARYLYNEQPELLDYLRISCLYAVEAQDNGQNLIDYDPENNYSNPFAWVRVMNINWDQDESLVQQRFEMAVDMAVNIVNQLIDRFTATKKAEELLLSWIKSRQEGSPVLVMPRFVPWQNIICDWNTFNPNDKIYAVVFPAMGGGYNCQIVPATKGSFELSCFFPPEWKGLKGIDLANTSGLPSAIFCHPAGFISGWAFQEDAIKAAQLATSWIVV